MYIYKDGKFIKADAGKEAKGATVKGDKGRKDEA